LESALAMHGRLRYVQEAWGLALESALAMHGRLRYVQEAWGLALESALAMHGRLRYVQEASPNQGSIQAEPCAKVTFWTDWKAQKPRPVDEPALTMPRTSESKSSTPTKGRRKLPSPPR